MEKEQSNPVDSVESSVWALEFDMKYLKNAEGYIGRNVVNVTLKMKTSPNTLNDENCQASLFFFYFPVEIIKSYFLSFGQKLPLGWLSIYLSIYLSAII